jgi:hypothetical protein
VNSTSKQNAKSTAQGKLLVRKAYIRPVMRTVITPTEIRDIDQPCAFYPGAGCDKKKRGGGG